MSQALPVPCFRSGFSGGGDRLETPDLLARLLIEGGEKSADAAIAAADTRNHKVPCDQRRRRRKVILAKVRHHGVPKQFARESVQCDQPGIFGGHEHAIAGDCRATIYPNGLPLWTLPLVAPDLAA